MCGFAGFCDKNERFYMNGKKIASDMADKIRHRGPDSEGVFSDSFFSVGFRRLKIIDLAGGEQPLYSADGRYVLCFNGEIYNYQTLRNELTEKFGVHFRTSSDTEVLLYCCIYYGRDVVRKLRGMYAFVLYDRKDKTLFCARDPFGIKPFYYGIFDGCLMFASEIKAFLAHPLFKKEFDSEVLPYYLQFQYVPTEGTAFKGVKRLMPGHFMFYDGEKLEKHRYFHFPVTHGGRFRSFSYLNSTVSEQKLNNNAKRAAVPLRSAISDSVNAHLVSDVPVGTFLSGGVDSGYITALAKPKKAFSIGFAEQGFDERSEAEECADKLGVKLVTEELSADEFFKLLPEVQYHSDEPYANLSAVPLYALARRASSEVKVILSGEGADELFGGYDDYYESRAKKLYGRFPRGVRSYLATHNGKMSKKIKAFTERNLQKTEEDFIGQARIMSAAEAYSLLSPPFKKLCPHTNVTEPIYSEIPSASPLQKKMYLDKRLWLPFDILCKADKMTMASSLELRVPYLDQKVLAEAQTLGDDALISKKTTKYALRVAATDVLPTEIAFRKKKGFPVPFREWIKSKKHSDILKTAFTGEICARFFEPHKLLTMLDEHVSGKENRARMLYTAYAFIVWYERFFETPEPSSAVMEITETEAQEVNK